MQPFVPILAKDAPPQLRAFWNLWQSEEFFACHEVLEELWRVTSGPRRLFYNGLIHAAVAIYQHRRGNAVGAARQWERTKSKLLPFAPEYDDVDVETLLRVVELEIAPSLRRLNDDEARGVETLRCDLRRKFSGSEGV